MTKDRKLFYIIYSSIKKKHPDWTREDVRQATIGLLARRKRKYVQ